MNNYNLIKIFKYAINIIISLFCIGSAFALDAPEVMFYDKPLYTFRGKTSGISIPISSEYTNAAAAWSQPRYGVSVGMSANYASVKFTDSSTADENKTNAHIGYFNHILCYKYNSSDKYFYPTGQVNSSKSCGASEFSGNYLNWATLSMLDLFRYSFTGGTRDLDKDDITVLKRSRITSEKELIVLANGQTDANGYDTGRFYDLFPIRVNEATSVTPDSTHKYGVNCGNNIYFSSSTLLFDTSNCSLMDTYAAFGLLKRYEARVQVCTPLDASLRPDYCKQYPNGNSKPIGEIQKNYLNSRFSLLSYLNLTNNLKDIFDSSAMLPQSFPAYKAPARGTWGNDLQFFAWGGVLRANARFIGSKYYDTNLNFSNNSQNEWDEKTGIFNADVNHKYVNGQLIAKTDTYTPLINGNESVNNGTSIVNYINHFGFYDRYRDLDPYTELIGESLRYLSNTSSSTSELNLPAIDSTRMYTSRDPLHFYKRITNEVLSTSKQEAYRLHTDTFPFIKSWNWANQGIDPPVRSTCENTNLITIADNNNWRSLIKSNGSPWQNTALYQSDTFFTGISLQSILNNIINSGLYFFYPDPEPSRALGEKTPQYDATYLYYPASPTGVGDGQNRYLLTGLLAGANLYGINYKNDSDISSIRVKSTIVDNGEPVFDPNDCSLYSAGIYGSFDSTSEINSYLSTTGRSCIAWNISRYYKSSVDDTLPSKGYFYPSSPNKIVNNVRRAFQLPFEATGNISPGTQQDNVYVNGKRQLYVFRNNLSVERSDLDTSISTDLTKYSLYLDNGVLKDEQNTVTNNWKSTLESSLRNSANTGRNMILGGVLDSSSLTRTTPVVFTYDGLSTANDTEALNALSIGLAQQEDKTLTATTLLTKRIAYLRGSNADEQTTSQKKLFRQRNHVLGSSANSSPLFVPKSSISGKNIVYLGANDGMMHAINADTGTEEFSFIPRALLDGLYEYTQQGYVDKPLMESTPNVSNIIPNSNTKDSNGKKISKTLLISGMGSGRKGLFGIDVTKLHKSGTAITKDDIAFEFTEEDDKYMGYVVGQPEFIVLKNGSKDANNKDIEETFIAVTSGYNNNNNSTTYNSDNQAQNPSYLYLLKTSKSYGAKWVEGTNYYKFKISDAVPNNGVSAPATFTLNGLGQYVYVGDLKGRLWRFDFEGGISASAKKVLTMEGESTLMPITVKPTVAISNVGGLIISFGTGRYFGLNDLGSSQRTKQALVTFKDRLGDSTYTLSNLNQRQISTSTKKSIAVGTDLASPKGWYVVMPNTTSKGERITTPVVIKDGLVLYTTQMLGQFGKTTCGENLGTASFVNLDDGLSGSYNIKTRFIGGLLILPDLDITIDTPKVGTNGNYVSRNYVSDGVYTTYGKAIDSSETYQSEYLKATAKYKSGTISWREIIDTELN